jgi:hypothetical protein
MLENCCPFLTDHPSHLVKEVEAHVLQPHVLVMPYVFCTETLFLTQINSPHEAFLWRLG